MRLVLVALAAFIATACGVGVVETPDMFDRLCQVLPEYRQARDAGADERASTLAGDVKDAIPEASLEGSSESFDRVLFEAADDASEGDFDSLDPIARANCLDAPG